MCLFHAGVRIPSFRTIVFVRTHSNHDKTSRFFVIRTTGRKNEYDTNKNGNPNCVTPTKIHALHSVSKPFSMHLDYHFTFPSSLSVHLSYISRLFTSFSYALTRSFLLVSAFSVAHLVAGAPCLSELVFRSPFETAYVP